MPATPAELLFRLTKAVHDHKNKLPEPEREALKSFYKRTYYQQAGQLLKKLQLYDI